MKKQFFLFALVCMSIATAVQPFGGRRRMSKEEQAAKRAERQDRRARVAKILGEEAPTWEKSQKKERRRKMLSMNDAERESFKMKKKAKFEDRMAHLAAMEDNEEAATLHKELLAKHEDMEQRRAEWEAKKAMRRERRVKREAKLTDILGADAMAEIGARPDWRTRQEEMAALSHEERKANRIAMRTIRAKRRAAIKEKLAAQEGNDDAAAHLAQMNKYEAKRSERRGRH